LGKGIIRFLEAGIRLSSNRTVVFKPSDFPWVAKIEAKHQAISREYNSLSESRDLPDICEISEEQYRVIEKNYWKFFPLYIYGIPIAENLLLCPETALAIESIPNKTTVFFSVIQPNAYIKEHRGAYKGYLRYHLGVQIPVPHSLCGLKIQKRVYHWENGKSLIFDDTYLHEAWNNSQKERVVLYVDFIRPMPRPLMEVSKALTYLISKSPFVQNGIAKLQAGKIDKEISMLLG
jgi:ornithine lipid ester-linked acyl 2-hydroxylase